MTFALVCSVCGCRKFSGVLSIPPTPDDKPLRCDNCGGRPTLQKVEEPEPPSLFE
jgi:hypothetical protein